MAQTRWVADVSASRNPIWQSSAPHSIISGFRAAPITTTPAKTQSTRKAPHSEEVVTDAGEVLAFPVLLLKCVLLWPDSQNVVTRFISRWILPLPVLGLAIGGAAFVLEGRYDSAITGLITFGDTFMLLVILLKLRLLSRDGPRLARMRRQLQTGFLAMERLAEPEAAAANARCVRRCHMISKRIVYFYIPLSVSVLSSIIYNAWEPPEIRNFFLNMPRDWMMNSYFYWPMLVVSVVSSCDFPFYQVGYDTLFLSLCLHMSCKCDILGIMLRRAGQRSAPRTYPVATITSTEPKRYDFEYWKDDGSALEPGSSNGLRDDVEENLKTCVLYHNMIIQLHTEMECIFSEVTLWQSAYLLLGLGVPALRLIREPIFKPLDVVFLIFYTAWNFVQLLFQCWFSDVLAESSEAVADAAYAALRPAEVGDSFNEWTTGRGRPHRPGMVNMSKAAGITLRLLTMRAQKPLCLTAGKLVKITLELYLAIIRKSESIYSYLIRMR